MSLMDVLMGCLVSKCKFMLFALNVTHVISEGPGLGLSGPVASSPPVSPVQLAQTLL